MWLSGSVWMCVPCCNMHVRVCLCVCASRCRVAFLYPPSSMPPVCGVVYIVLRLLCPGCGLTADAAVVIAPALSHAPQLHELYCSGTLVVRLCLVTCMRFTAWWHARFFLSVFVHSSQPPPTSVMVGVCVSHVAACSMCATADLQMGSVIMCGAVVWCGVQTTPHWERLACKRCSTPCLPPP